MSDIIKRTLKGGSFFLASNVINKILGFLFIVLCSRYLGPVEFGVFALGLSVSGIAVNLGSFGLPTTIQRFLSGDIDSKSHSKTYGGVLTLYVIVSLIFALCLFVFSSLISTSLFNEPKLTIVLKIFAVGLLTNIGFRIYKSILQAQENLTQFLIGSTGQSVLKIIFLLLLLTWYQNAITAAFVTELAFLFGLIYLIVSVDKLPIKPELPTARELKKVLNYTLPLVFVGFSYFLAQQTDRLMLGWLSTSSDVGLYTVSSTLAFIMTTLHGSLVAIFMPLASEAYINRNMQELNKAYLFISKWTGSLNAIFSLIFAGFGMFLLSIFGSEYSTETTYQILLVLTVLYFLGTWVGPTGALLQMADGHRIEMYNTALYLALNIGFNYIFILKFGLIGAAWGTLLSGFVRNMLQVIQIRYLYKLNVINRNNLKLLFIVIMGMALCLLIGNYSLYISLIFIGLVVLYAIKHITEEEKNLIGKYMSKYV